jgi:polysaccharide biosynthesis transport protein
MAQSIDLASVESDVSDVENISTARMVQSALRFFLAVRYRKNLVIAVLAAAALLGGLYYATAPRRYSSKAALLVTQTGHDKLDTSITNEQSQRDNAMATFENLVRSDKVVEGALKNLMAADLTELAGLPHDRQVATMKQNLTAKGLRSTSILEVSYNADSPQAAVNIVQAVVQSYLDFMDTMHKGTANELNRMLTQERNEIEEKLTSKQSDLLQTRRRFADMGIASDNKTLHPTIQTAVSFNDALTTAKRQRAEHEALLASIQAAILNGQDLGQFMMSIGDTVGREILLNSLGLAGRDTTSLANIEQTLFSDRAQLQTLQQNLGPNHPEVVTLAEKVRAAEQYLATSEARLQQRVTGLRNSELGPWLMQMVQQRLDEAKRREAILQDRFEQARNDAVNLSGQVAQIELLECDVKRLKEMSNILFNQISSLDLRQNGQDVRVAVVEAPKLPTSPAWPRRSIVIVATVLGGLLIAFGLVTLLDALDDRFRSMEEMQTRLGLPLLAMLQPTKLAESVGAAALVTHTLPTSAASENFRTLRTSLTLTHPDARRLVVTSPEPGDGKTTTLANLAVCYAQADKRTLLIDADMRRPGLTNLMNMRGPHGLSEVLRSSVELSQMAPQCIQPSGIARLDILPCGARPSDPAELLGSPRFSELLAWAESVYDQVLVDSPPTLAATDTAIVGRIVDGVILVVQPAKNHRRLVTRVIERLTLLKIPLLGMVANRVDSSEDRGYYGYHNYGYGYGYGSGYGSGYGYGSDDDERAKSEAAAGGEDKQECVPFKDDGRGGSDEGEDSRSLLVPRRVA